MVQSTQTVRRSAGNPREQLIVRYAGTPVITRPKYTAKQVHNRRISLVACLGLVGALFGLLGPVGAIMPEGQSCDFRGENCVTTGAPINWGAVAICLGLALLFGLATFFLKRHWGLNFTAEDDDEQ